MDDFEGFDPELSDAVDLFHDSFIDKAADPKGPSAREEVHEEPRRAKKPEPAEHDEPEEEVDETEDEPDEAPSEDDETEEGDEGDEGEEEERAYADDGAYVKIKVGDKYEEYSVRDLSRLAGQESALTKRSQEVAVTRQKLETDQAAHIAASNLLLEAARKRYEPYAKLDFLTLARDQRISAQDYQNLREEAQHRYEELQFLEHSTGKYMETIQENQRQTVIAQAKEAVSQITDQASPYHIDGWNQALYDDLRGFAVGQGVPKDMVNTITSAPIIKLLHNAMLYEKGKTARVQSVKVNKTVKKVVKSSTNMSEKVGKGAKANNAMDRLKYSGSQDDAANAFLANFEKYGDFE
jgi:hypothetical protein